MSTVGKKVTRARHILASEYSAPSNQPTREFDDEELLLELPLLRLGIDGKTPIEVGGDIVRSAARVPGMFPKARNARASSNSADTATQRLNPTLQRDLPNILKNTF